MNERRALEIVNTLLLALALGLTPARVSFAEDASPILVVDMKRILNDSVPGKAAMNNVEQERKKQQIKIDKAQLELKQLQDSFEKQSALLSGTARAEKERELRGNERELQARFQEIEMDLLKKKNAEVLKVVDEVQKIVKELGAEKKSKFVIDLDPRVVVYASDKIDVTPEVIEKLDDSKLAG